MTANNQNIMVNLRGYASEYGTFVGAVWGLVFFMFVYGIRLNSNLLLFLGMLSFLVLPAVPCLFTLRLKRNLRDHMPMGFLRALLFSLNMLFYASLLQAAIVFVYFQWMDHGSLVQQVHDMLFMPEIQQAYRDAGATNMLKQFEQSLDLFAQQSPFSVALSWLTQNIFISVFLALPAALCLRSSNAAPQRS